MALHPLRREAYVVLRQDGHFLALFLEGTKRIWFKEKWLRFVIAEGSWREKVNAQEMHVGLQIESKEHW